MIHNFIGNKVTVYCGVYSYILGPDVGTITDIDDKWLQLETKKDVIIIEIDRISKIKLRK